MRYMCEICGESFIDKDECLEHEREHERDEIYGTVREMPGCTAFVPTGCVFMSNDYNLISGVAIDFCDKGIVISNSHYEEPRVREAAIIHNFKSRMGDYMARMIDYHIKRGRELTYEEWRLTEDGRL